MRSRDFNVLVHFGTACDFSCWPTVGFDFFSAAAAVVVIGEWFPCSTEQLYSRVLTTHHAHHFQFRWWKMHSNPFFLGHNSAALNKCTMLMVIVCANVLGVRHISEPIHLYHRQSAMHFGLIIMNKSESLPTTDKVHIRQSDARVSYANIYMKAFRYYLAASNWNLFKPVRGSGHSIKNDDARVLCAWHCVQFPRSGHSFFVPGGMKSCRQYQLNWKSLIRTYIHPTGCLCE